MLFLIHVCGKDDERLAKELIKEIRSFYSFPLQVISDGPASEDFQAYCWQALAGLHIGDRIKPFGKGAAWTKRWMQLCLKWKDPGILHLDADSILARRVRSWPSRNCELAGQMLCHCYTKKLYPRGGGIFWRLKTLKKIINSGVLDDEKYNDPASFSYHRYGPEFGYAGEERSNALLYAECPTLGDIISRLELKTENWDEVYLATKEPHPDNSSLKWAITHPRRTK